MEKLYERQIFKNDDVPALNETNLNILTKAVDDIDNRLKDVIPADDYIEIARQTQEYARQAEESAEKAQTTEVIVDALVTTGTHIADISVNGHKKEIYAPQGGGSTINVIDNLDSDSSVDALSAKQGKELNNKFGGVKFGIDGDGNYGYYKADDSFNPFSKKVAHIIVSTHGNANSTQGMYYLRLNDEFDEHFDVVTNMASAGTSTAIINCKKKCKIAYKFLCGGRGASNAVRRIFFLKETKIFDETINETNWLARYPDGISGEAELDIGESLSIDCRYYNTVPKSCSLEITIDG